MGVTSTKRSPWACNHNWPPKIFFRNVGLQTASYKQWGANSCMQTRTQCHYTKTWAQLINHFSSVVSIIHLVTFPRDTGPDYKQLEHWNRTLMASVNLMVRGPFSLLIVEVKRALWGHRPQIYNWEVLPQRPLHCAFKWGGSEKSVFLQFGQTVTWKSRSGNWAKEEAERNMACVNTPSAPRAHSTITYGMPCISIDPVG